MATSTPPAYACELKAMHRAHHAELLRLVGLVPIQPPRRILDIACGEGYYTRLLSDRNSGGETIGIDTSDACIEAARRQTAAQADLQFQRADAYHLPFAADEFDVVWCGHSLHSLRYTEQLLHEMRRVLRPDGRIAIVEVDSLHHMILPLPVDLELGIHRAAHALANSQRGNRRRKYFSRWSSGLLHDAGLELVDRHTIAVDRCAPLSDADREFLARYLEDLWKRLESFVNQRCRKRLQAYMLPEGDRYLPDTQDLVYTVLNTLVIAKVE
jgi:ubiquinone/menaquinone biosynthesis C-methylase UbiE